MELDPEDFRALLRFDTDAELTYFHRSILSTGSPDRPRFSADLRSELPQSVWAPAGWSPAVSPEPPHGLPCRRSHDAGVRALPAGTKPAVLVCLTCSLLWFILSPFSRARQLEWRNGCSARRS